MLETLYTISYVEACLTESQTLNGTCVFTSSKVMDDRRFLYLPNIHMAEKVDQVQQIIDMHYLGIRS